MISEVDMERVMGIEPTLSAWEAEVLPLNYTRTSPDSRVSGSAVKLFSGTEICTIQGAFGRVLISSQRARSLAP